MIKHITTSYYYHQSDDKDGQLQSYISSRFSFGWLCLFSQLIVYKERRNYGHFIVWRRVSPKTCMVIMAIIIIIIIMAIIAVTVLYEERVIPWKKFSYFLLQMIVMHIRYYLENGRQRGGCSGQGTTEMQKRTGLRRKRYTIFLPVNITTIKITIIAIHIEEDDMVCKGTV